MITKLTGQLLRLGEEAAVIESPPFEYQVFVSEFTRRQLQSEVGRTIRLHTIHYIDGNAAQGGRLSPRLVGFVNEIEREFFDLFCSVDGVGVKKALRAMVRAVPDIAHAIEQQDHRTISTLPGIGPATAERVVAKLRRKMAKFALLVTQQAKELTPEQRDLADETFQVLLVLGHSERDARMLLDKAIKKGKKYKDVESMLQAIYQGSQADSTASDG